MQIAGRIGPIFRLDEASENLLGRSDEVHVALADRLASRRHAGIFRRGSGWVLRDLGSRNGTWVDGEPIKEIPLQDGMTIRIGLTELVFRHVVAASETAGEAASGPRLVRSGPVERIEGDAVSRRLTADAVGTPGELLYRASLRLLASRAAPEVICAMLEMAIDSTAASQVGWFRAVSGGDLEPVCVVPPGGPLAEQLQRPLVADTVRRLVIGKGHAVWLQADEAPGEHAEEIICIPLCDGGTTHAAVAASNVLGRIREADFDLLVALASLAAAAWSGHAMSEQTGGPQAAGDAVGNDLSNLDTIDLDEAIATAGDEGTLAASDIGRLADDGEEPPAAGVTSFVSAADSLKLRDWQRELVAEALRRADGQLDEAASSLGISHEMLRRTLNRYGFSDSR